MKKKLSILLALAVIIAALTLSVSAAGVVEPVPITPNMSQEEVDDAVAKAAESGAVLAVEPGNYGIEGENNHIKITLKHGNQTVQLQGGDYYRLMLVVLTEGNVLQGNGATIYGDVTTVYNQSPAIYVPYGSIEIQGNLTIDDHDYGVILGYTNGTDQMASELVLAENASLSILNCSTVNGNTSYDNGIVCAGTNYFSYVDTQGDGTRGSAITTKGTGNTRAVITISEGAELTAEDCYGAGVYSVNADNLTMNIEPGAEVNLTRNGQGVCMNTDYTGSVNINVDNAILNITGNRSNGITGQSRPYLLDIKNNATVNVDDNGGIGINNFYIKVSDSELSVSGNGSHGATNVAFDAYDSTLNFNDNEYIGLNISKYNEKEEQEDSTEIVGSTVKAGNNGGPGIRFYINGGNTKITDSSIVTNGNGVGDEIYGYIANPVDSGAWAGIVGKGTVVVTDSYITSTSAAGYSLYNAGSSPSRLYISGTDVVAFDASENMSDSDIFDDWNSQGNTGRTYVNGGSLQAEYGQMTVRMNHIMNMLVPENTMNSGRGKEEIQYAAPVNSYNTALTRFDLHKAINAVVNGDGANTFTVYDPNANTSYNYAFRYNTDAEDLTGVGGNAYVWTPVTVIHYDATEGTVGQLGTAKSGNVVLNNTRGDQSSIDNIVVANGDYIDATDYTICGNSLALSEGALPTATCEGYTFAGWYYAVGDDIETAAGYAQNGQYSQLYSLLLSNGRRFSDTTMTSDDGANLDEITVYAVWLDSVNTLTITPADITIYMGADGGYESVITGEGGNAQENNGLPEPGYYITLPDWVNALLDGETDTSGAVDLSPILTFNYDVGEESRVWKLERYHKEGDSEAYNKYVYRLVPGADQVNVRLEFKDEDGNITTSESFAPAPGTLHQEYDMTIYPGALQQELVKASITIGGKPYKFDVKAEPGKLTIRGVTGEEDTVSLDGGVSTESGFAASVPEDTTYTINGSDIGLNDQRGVQLLVDELVQHEDDDITQQIFDAMTDRALEAISAELGNVNTDFAYMNLVDTNNGNVYVTANNPVTVTWPYPAGTDSNDTFYIVHFTDMNRGTNLTEGAIASAAVESLETENTENGIRFTVNSFSPFVLVWSDEGGGWNPPDTDDDKPEKPGGLNTEDHVAYIIGYPDGEVKPEGNITRAEVATIFFRLLTDETRDEYWSKTNSYTDVPSDRWFNNAISTLSNMGIIDGYADGSFRPDAPITRAEFTKIAVSFFEYADYVYENTFADVRSGSWYTQFIAAAVEIGLIEGYPDGTFRPDNYITRAEACTIVNRTLNRAPDEDHLLPESVMITWPDNQPGTWYYADMQEATNSHDYDWLGSIEDWTEKLEERDWEALEKLWSDSHDAPGGEVMG